MFNVICFAPLILVFLYSFYLLIRPKNMDDEFFHLSNKTGKDVMIARIKLLEQINNKDYKGYIKEIEKFYSDGIITESESDRMEEMITNMYFNNFKERWSAFKRAELPMKIIFIALLAYGFFYASLLVFVVYHQDKYATGFPFTYIIIVDVSLIFPYLLALTLLGFFALIISMFNLFFSKYGGINRAAITSTELIKSLKPGGRTTEITTPGRGFSTRIYP